MFGKINFLEAQFLLVYLIMEESWQFKHYGLDHG